MRRALPPAAYEGGPSAREERWVDLPLAVQPAA